MSLRGLSCNGSLYSRVLRCSSGLIILRKEASDSIHGDSRCRGLWGAMGNSRQIVRDWASRARKRPGESPRSHKRAEWPALPT